MWSSETSMRELSYTVPPHQAGRSVESLLRGEMHLSKRLLQSLKWRPGAICRTGAPVRAQVRAAAGDVLCVRLGERRAPSPHILPCDLPLEILYEDRDLLVLNKPALVPMHSSANYEARSMAGALRAYLGADTTAHFVNRLDRGTSGLCIAAKNGYIHDRFRACAHTEKLHREYLALAEGTLTPEQGVVALPIGGAEGEFYRRCVRPDGQWARTAYETLAHTSSGLTLLRLVPETGRTHQLRVHMAALGHPLAGDTLYGAAERGDLPRSALHACLLRFVHPVTGETLCFTAPLPEDMAALLSGPAPVSDGSVCCPAQSRTVSPSRAKAQPGVKSRSAASAAESIASVCSGS